jgi:selenocysteine-specific translation elongation factor
VTARVLVERLFHIAGRGPVVTGLLHEGDISTGDWLVVSETGATVQVRGLETHVPQPATGRRIGLLVRPEDALKVMTGSTLVSPPTH